MKVVVVLAASLQVNVEIEVNGPKHSGEIPKEFRTEVIEHAIQQVREGLDIDASTIDWTPQSVSITLEE